MVHTTPLIWPPDLSLLSERGPFADLANVLLIIRASGPLESRTTMSVRRLSVETIRKIKDAEGYVLYNAIRAVAEVIRAGAAEVTLTSWYELG